MRRQTGVTLIELLTVVLIVGILTAIAVPSYRRYVVRTNRTDAKIALTQAAQQLERCYTRTSTYQGCVTVPYNVASNNYQVDADAGANPAGIQANTFALKATPLGAQAQDTQCGTFKLTQAGVQSVTGTLGASSCW